MSDGLVTRIGKWIDLKWESKATESQLQNIAKTCQERYIGALDAILETKEVAKAAGTNNDLSELKTRLEKLELYVGMTRKVDPTKPAVVKSAFSM